MAINPRITNTTAAVAASTVGRQIAVMVTRRCTMTCSHCSVESSPQVAGRQPSQDELLRIVRDAAAAGVKSIQFTGGEPMMRPTLVLRLMREARRRGITSALSTNGFWGRSPAAALRNLRLLLKAGLHRLTVSYDRFHAEHQGPEPAVNIVRAAGQLSFPVNVNVTRLAGEEGLEQVVTPFSELPMAQLRFYDVQPVGAAIRTVAEDGWRGETSGFCNACDAPAITDDGRMTACNGPSYFAPAGHPLHVGSLQERTLAELLAVHRDDPVLDTIRTFGPERLRTELLLEPGFENFPFRERYRGMCDLCLHVTGRPDAVAALRVRLSDSRHAAERLAMRQIIVDQRRAGSLCRRTVNAEAAARLFHRAMQGAAAARSAESARVIGRADLDWQQQADILVAGGLARPLLSVLDDPELTRFAPQFFTDRIRRAAVRDGIRELAQREVLRVIHDELATLGGRGVLLKGAAIMAIGDPAVPTRAAGDIDLHVDCALAGELRRRLLRRGFTGDADGGRSGPHHLAAVCSRGVSVEIHTRIMPGCWGLPEDEMLAQARPLPQGCWSSLATLSLEGMVLHCLMHTTTHLFAQGGKAGWDVAFLVRHAGAAFDWQAVARWAAASRVPRAFWAPARVVAEELDLPLPADLFAAGPTDGRQRQLELIARRRLFGPAESADEINPLSRTAVFLLLHDGLPRRLGYLAWLLGPEAGESRRTARKRAVTQRLSSLPAHLRQALVQYRHFRSAAAADL